MVNIRTEAADMYLAAFESGTAVGEHDNRIVKIILLFYAPGRIRALSDFMCNGLGGGVMCNGCAAVVDRPWVVRSDRKHETKNSQKLSILSTTVAKPSSSLATAEFDDDCVLPPVTRSCIIEGESPALV